MNRRIDMAAAFTASHYGERASAIELVGAGEWSQAYAFLLEGREAIVRFGHHAEDFAKDAAMGDTTVRRLPVPKVLEVGKTGTGYFAVSERRHGQFLDGLDGTQMRAALPSLLATLDALTEVDLSASDGYGIWTADQGGPYDSWPDALLAINADRPRIGDWRTTLERSPVGMGAFNLGLAKLGELAPHLPTGRHLIHGDLLNRNVLVTDNRITAVFDWGNAMYGDALYDAAWLIYWWPWYPSWSDLDILTELTDHWRGRGDLTADVDNRLLAYQLHIGLDHLAYTASTDRTDRTEDLLRNDRQVRRLVDRANNRRSEGHH